MQGSVRKRGDKWYYSFEMASVDGQRHRPERVGGRTKKEALATMRKAMAKYEQAGQLIDENNISVADYFDLWLEKYVKPNRRNNTYIMYESLLKNHIKPALGHFYLRHLTPAAIQDFFTSKQAEGLSESTIRLIRAVMSIGLKMAVYPYQYIQSTPMQYLSLPKEKKEHKKEDLKIITKEQFGMILKEYPLSSDYHVTFQVGYHSGLRPGETCALKWENVDLKSKTITVAYTQHAKRGGGFELGPPKNQSSFRTIAISDYLVKVLKQQRKNQRRNKLKYGPYYMITDFVCTRENGEPILLPSFEAAARKLQNRLGFPFTPHSLRHTHATDLLAAGANMKAVQRRLGHATLNMTMNTYAHVTKNMEESLRELLDEIVGIEM